MPRVKAVSFDVEGTLVTPEFSQAVWNEAIPSLYAKKHRMSVEEATAIVRNEYDEVGDQSKQWYDIKYWFDRFQLGDYRQVLHNHKSKLSCYAEVIPVLSSLANEYTLIVATSSAREFLGYMLSTVETYFARVFSSISDYGQLKSPSFYLWVCHQMGVLPHELAHVGDSWEFDFMAAKEAGIQAFHLDRRSERRHADSLTSLTHLKTRLPTSCAWW